MSKSQSQSKAFKTILFILLTVISLYYIYMMYDFIKSVSVNVGRNGFVFYSKFPTVLIGGALQYILGTALFILLSVKYFGYSFLGKQQKAGFITVISAGLLLAVAVSEELSYLSYKGLLGRGYKVLLHLRSLLNFDGIVRAVVVLFLIFMLTASIIFMAKQRRELKE